MWLGVGTANAQCLPSPVFCRKLQIFQICTFLKPRKIFPLRILKSVFLFCEKMSDIPWIEKYSPVKKFKMGGERVVRHLFRSPKFKNSILTSASQQGPLLSTSKSQVLCLNIERPMKIFFYLHHIFIFFILSSLNSHPYQSMAYTILHIHS